MILCVSSTSRFLTVLLQFSGEIPVLIVLKITKRLCQVLMGLGIDFCSSGMCLLWRIVSIHWKHKFVTKSVCIRFRLFFNSYKLAAVWVCAWQTEYYWRDSRVDLECGFVNFILNTIILFNIWGYFWQLHTLLTLAIWYVRTSHKHARNFQRGQDTPKKRSSIPSASVHYMIKLVNFAFVLLGYVASACAVCAPCYTFILTLIYNICHCIL